MKEEPTFGDNQGVMTEPHSLTTDMRLRVHKAILEAQGLVAF
jgi:hypothetical protein